MIYVIVIFFDLLAPWIGVIGMENGAYSLTASEYGYKVGATQAFLMHIVLIALTIYVLNNFKVFKKGNFKLPDAFFSMENKIGNQNVELIAIVFLSALFAFHNLILAGGLSVVEGMTGRGEFRTGLGGNGALSYLVIKWYAPVLLAYSCVVCFRSYNFWSYVLTSIVFAFCLMSSMSFGYKAAIVLLVTPSLMILFWKPKIVTLLLFPSFGLTLIIGGYLFFGTDKVGSAANGFLKNGVLDQLIYRVFVLQGELPWKIWGEYVLGNELPSYAVTLKSLLGGRLGGLLFGAGSQMPEAIVATNFGMMTTHFAGYPIEGVLAGNNATATAFSEGVIAGGILGVILVSILAGIVIYSVYRALDFSIANKYNIYSSVLSVYSIFGVMSWLIGGGISTLIHISVVFGFITSILMLMAIKSLARN
ncbi:MAG: hypothetical protein COB78_13350 [Hyphomicrobiales bacterium]|nr:MAG: hypothetical protein COB78_13350 [Hyphomicrobiales bacterium]